ncbi:hypothetical protein D3Z47_02170 [Lachnospiraceae bacterium]|nr:hypothetical protein [Lachnospiraceae bacterium]
MKRVGKILEAFLTDRLRVDSGTERRNSEHKISMWFLSGCSYDGRNFSRTGHISLRRMYALKQNTIK